MAVEVTNYNVGSGQVRVRMLYRNPPAVGKGFELTTSAPMETNRWHHVVARVTTKEMALWVDGEPAVSGLHHASNDPFPAQMRVMLGHRSGHGKSDQRFYDGLIDEVAIFDKPLTYDQIRQQYREGRRLFPLSKESE